MEESIEEQIQKRLEELPEDIQAVVSSADLYPKLQAIGRKHGLHLDQIEKMGDETMLFMLGFVKPEDFVAGLASQVRLSPEQASAVAADINNDILLSIRESLKNFVPKQSVSTPAAAADTAPQTPLAPSASTTPPSTLHPADMMLSQKTVTVPPPATNTPAPLPQKPTGYKADPYREPPTP